MTPEDLQKKVELFYKTSHGYRLKNTHWISEVDKILNGDDVDDIYTRLSRVYNQKNIRQSPLVRTGKVSEAGLKRRYKTRMARNLARFQATFGRSLINASSAARGGTAEQYVHNIAGDSASGDVLTEIINDLLANDNTEKKLPRMAAEIFKYNSALLVIDKYGAKGPVFKLNTRVYSGRDVLYDEWSDPLNIQSSRFVGIDGFNYTKDMLHRLLQEEGADNRGYDKEAIQKLIRMTSGENGDIDNETPIPMVQMYIYDEDTETTHFVIFDEKMKIIIRHTEEKLAFIGGREVRFNLVGGIRNSDEGGHYSRSDFSQQIPLLKSRVTMVIDTLTAVNQLRANVALVHPQAYSHVLRAFVDNFPIAQASPSSSTVPIQNQLTTLDTPNLNGIQNVLAQFEELSSRLYPENTPELAGAVSDKLKSVYEGNLGVINRIIQSQSPLENAIRDLYLIVIKAISKNPSHEFLIRSDSFAGLAAERILSSKILKTDGKINSVAIDIRKVHGGETDFVLRKELLSSLLASAQQGGVNVSNLSKYLARNSNKTMIRFTPDDRYAIFSPYSEEVVRRVLNDLKMAALGEDIRYPDGFVGEDYIKVLQDCIKQKGHSYLNPDGTFTEAGKRIYDYAQDALRRFADSVAESSLGFQENRLATQEAEQVFNQPDPEASESVKSLFANQQTEPAAVANPV